MYLHLGEGYVASVGGIVGIFDLENTTIGQDTRLLLDDMTKNNQVITIGADLPKSFVLWEKNQQRKLYISPISVRTLKKRYDMLTEKE